MFGIPQIISSGDLYTILVFTFFLGFFTGAGRCLFICGPLFVPLAASRAEDQRGGCGMALAFGAGRILTYVLLGALFGFFGKTLAQVIGSPGFTGLAYGAVGILGISMGLVLLSKKNRGFLPCRFTKGLMKGQGSIMGAFFLGFAVGWVPCPPLIEILALTLAEGRIGLGASMLLVFGIGTAVPLLPLGYFSGGISSRFMVEHKMRHLDRLAGMVLLLFGSYLVLISRDLH